MRRELLAAFLLALGGAVSFRGMSSDAVNCDADPSPYKNESSCLSKGCTWCFCAAVPSSCHSYAIASKLPSSDFNCGNSTGPIVPGECRYDCKNGRVVRPTPRAEPTTDSAPHSRHCSRPCMQDVHCKQHVPRRPWLQLVQERCCAQLLLHICR
jgi:hypothetical protein